MGVCESAAPGVRLPRTGTACLRAAVEYHPFGSPRRRPRVRSRPHDWRPVPPWWLQWLVVGTCSVSRPASGRTTPVDDYLVENEIVGDGGACSEHACLGADVALFDGSCDGWPRSALPRTSCLPCSLLPDANLPMGGVRYASDRIAAPRRPMAGSEPPPLPSPFRSLRARISSEGADRACSF